MCLLIATDAPHIFDHTHDLWNELCGTRLFAIGGMVF